jgi:hypothetical protein
MKLSLVALVAGCAVASSAFAVMDSPPTLPPGAAVMGLPRTNARHHA